MENSMEKYLAEIQFLRKQVSGEKLAHENTLKQLQAAYLLLEDIKDALRQEQTDNNKLKAQLAQTALSLTTTTQQYEAQINEVKELLTVKDEELRRISAYLRVNDVDIIRMKVVNELQLDHAEKIERLNADVAKKGIEVSELKNSFTLLQEKYQMLQQIKEEQQRENEQRIEEVAQRHFEELASVHTLMERERSERHKWEKKHQGLQQRFSKQSEFYQGQIQQLRRELQSENKSVLSNNETRLNKHKLEKQEETISSLKQQLAAEKQSNTSLEQELSRLRKDLKDSKRAEQDHILGKERAEEEIQQLKKELAHSQTQHKKRIEALQREADNRTDHPREERHKIQSLEAEISRTAHRLQQLQRENQSLRQQAADKHLANLKKELAEKDDQIDALRNELRGLKLHKREEERREGQRRRTVSVQEKEGAHYKAKLQQANDKIVELLREKIELKQKINPFQGK